MKNNNTLLIMALTVVLSACTGSQPGIGLRLENMNDSVAPGTDFYQYACGGWIKNNPLKPEYGRFGSFDVVAENNREQLRTLIEELSTQENEPGSVAQKIGDLYNMMMDSVRMNDEGLTPVMSDYAAIESLDDRDALIRQFIQNDLDGQGFLFGWGIGADIENSTMNIVSLGQGGLTLGNRDYYVNDDEATVKIREAFKQHIVNVFRLMGDDDAVATRKMQSVMDIETAIAQVNKSRTQLRDIADNYHKMSYADLLTTLPGFPWDAFWEANGISGLDTLDVGQPEAILNAINLLNTTPLQQLRDWMQWKLVHSNSDCLGDELYAENFDFFGRTLQGKQEMQPRWKRAVAAVSSLLGEAIGEMYVQKYFPAQNKERMLQLVHNLQEALVQRIDAQDWMSDTTKAQAKDKLAAFYVKIGYPDKWKDYSQLVIDPSKSLYEASKDYTHWAQAKEIEERYQKPVDRDEWHMTPQTVNAYYNPTTNEICFPAGILQYPFFDMSADDAFNYGAIGVVIGHEMTHGFDDKGAQFDKEGNFVNWWTEEDQAKFAQKTQAMVNFFDGIEVLPGLHANGSLTQGENIADHGGLKIAFQAFQNATKDAPLPTVNGFTPEQRFFLAYANVWAQNITEANMRQLTTSDPHSLGEWRVNGALPHIDAWYEAFGITEDDPMYIPKDQRVNIW